MSVLVDQWKSDAQVALAVREDEIVRGLASDHVAETERLVGVREQELEAAKNRLDEAHAKRDEAHAALGELGDVPPPVVETAEDPTEEATETVTEESTEAPAA